VHATAEEAQEETLRMLHTYADFAQNVAAIPVIVGQKSESEKFAGARATYSIEAMMQDGKALQAGTSHNFGTNFSVPFDIQFLDKDGKRKYVHETSWGLSTRMIGAIIMVHGDERGLVLPPKLAPIQAVVLPIAMHKPGVLESAKAIAETLQNAGIRTNLDDRETQSAGWKFNEWEMKGVPIRIEIGPRDLEQNQVTLVRRDTLEKSTLAIEGLTQAVSALLDNIHKQMFIKAQAFMTQHITPVQNMEALSDAVQSGFALAHFCENEACEDVIKAATGATTRNFPFEQSDSEGVCVYCGKPAKRVVYFAKAY
jgi:prolyl-tRNA synthetase